MPSTDISSVRQHNLSLIIRMLRIQQAQSRAELTTLTGLTRSTMSSLIDELMAINLVHETGMQASSGGRPGIKVELNPEAGFVVGVDMNVGYIRIVLTDYLAKPIWEKLCKITTTRQEEMLTQAEEIIAEALEFGDAQNLRPLGIGVGLPGLVSKIDGQLIIAPILQWRDLPLKTLWQERFGLPVYVENKSTAAAIGEKLFGAAKEVSDFIYLGIHSAGVGAGIFINNAPFRGVNGFAGEVGQMFLRRPATEIASQLDGWGACQQAVNQIMAGRPSLIMDRVAGALDTMTLEHIIQAAQSRDALATEIVDHMCLILSHGIAYLVEILDIQFFAVGGKLGHLLQAYLPSIQQTIAEHHLISANRVPEIRISSLGELADAIGSVSLVLETIDSNPSLLSKSQQP